MPQLARRIGRAKPSAIMQVAEKAKRLKAEGRDIISFSIGVPNFLPGDHVYAAVREALAKDSGQYGSNRGADALLDAFIEHMSKIGLTGYGRVNCATGIGAKHVIYNIAEALLDEGDTIVFPTPYWTSYLDIAEIVNAKIDLLPCPASQDYKLTPAQLEVALAKKPKVFLFNNPSNPTGMVYGKDEIDALAAVIAKYPDTWVITDDIYNRMVFDGLGYHNFVHSHPELRDRVIFIDSLSKTYGMPGWRVGFMAGPEVIAQAVTTMNSNHITNVPEIVTAAAVAALSGPQDVPTARCAEFQAKRDQVMDVMNSIPGVVCPRPQGAFYVFPDISVAFGKTHGPSGLKIGNDMDLCNALLETKGVACVPGSAFGEPRALRISYTCPTPQLAPGLQRFQEFFAELA
ncbi:MULTISPECIES: pyridoxal phosphate-dependent aminotransferase [unclassified Lysobacter]|uniref:pyridoxal phosphate-dependent aminotransferase n=1 Tax=unclassified Lysobacter TaxID=2635362 RepID=UPI001BEB6E21|nr:MULTISPECIES: pyridoxal phosphate-dependent aminotransferase [unclassified Lysobacter]MBT2747641.1 pyridoxal phosphate-dependent aminotransferase [Lysobacter sp. ISL-42]MBT2752300.1 pyridoxal phosphate-dependent aminotransferase [Lysobacter sp. ISL-50]MBT2777441.1 pyridoxal phosphate-dependent aminotransferase [Lysobacter sp. ISL-54]MBT2784413.1 pyridoxal phosphate-dependent aminotransferase [Lysobacter sp. ISL-52]